MISRAREALGADVSRHRRGRRTFGGTVSSNPAPSSQPAFLADESAIELVDLLDEVLGARAVEAHPLEQLDAL
jgi:hypothetical protein